jgi:CubicO group peptidase (beta-lactamase class C family)
MKTIRAGVVLLAFCVYLSSCVQAQELLSKSERYLNSQVLEKRFSGRVLVAKGDKILLNRNFGAPSALNTVVVKNQYRFPVGSIAEQFSAAAILQLEEAGKVKLGNSVCDYITDCPGDWKQIQILHLLTHSSGLSLLEGISSCGGISSRPSIPSELIAKISNTPLAFKPGERFNDNKLDYIFLRWVIERISGQSIQEYLDQHIFRPLQMSLTGYLVPYIHQNSTTTIPMKGCGEVEQPTTERSSVFTSELYSTTNDLYRWNRALTKQELLSKQSFEQIFTPFIEGHGFGWMIIKEFDRKVAIQDSEWNSASLSIRRYPDDDTYVIVYIAAGDINASSLNHDLGAIFFGKNYPPVSSHAPH